MSQSNSKSASPLMALVKTTGGIDFLGWITRSCEHSLTIEVTELGQQGWVVTLPWDDVTDLVDVTDFMTRTLDSEVR